MARRAVRSDGVAEKPDSESCGRLGGAHPDCDDLSRERIDDRAHEDRAEDAADAREVHEPDVIGTLREEPARATRKDASAGDRPGRVLAERGVLRGDWPASERFASQRSWARAISRATTKRARSIAGACLPPLGRTGSRDPAVIITLDVNRCAG
jgi:hypothetical protein